MTNPSPLTKTSDGCILAVHVTPKASKNAIEAAKADVDGNTWLRVKITTPPEDGKANKALISLLAKLLDVAARKFTLLSGETSRYKRLHVAIPYDEVDAWLKQISRSSRPPKN